MSFSDKDIYRYHEEVFKPLYADLVAVLGRKPEQISFELEAAFSRMAFAATNQEKKDENYEKALMHLKRAALDASKILWLEYRERATEIIGDKELSKYSIEEDSSKIFLELYSDAESLAKNARKVEISLEEGASDNAIELYYESATKFSDALAIVDKPIYRKIKSAKKQKMMMSWLSGALATGIGAALVADMLSSQLGIVLAAGLFGVLIGLLANGVRQWTK